MPLVLSVPGNLFSLTRYRHKHLQYQQEGKKLTPRLIGAHLDVPPQPDEGFLIHGLRPYCPSQSFDRVGRQ